MGRKYNYVCNGVKERGSSPFQRLGVIDYECADFQYIEKSQQAVKWLRDLNENGDKWSLNPPSRKELLPNMCCDSGKWNKTKEEIAANKGDITMIWQCGVKNREIAASSGIYSWYDLRCNSFTLGVSQNHRVTVDKIININRQSTDNIWPRVIHSNLYNWKSRESNEMFVDFETMSNIFTSNGSVENSDSSEMIFMIGVGYEENNKWVYRNFTANNSTKEEEGRIMGEFIRFVEGRSSPKLYYWHAENKFWMSALERHNLLHSGIDIWKYYTESITGSRIGDNYRWADMCYIFKNEPIVVRGSFNFGLKSIAKAMYNHKLIKTNLDVDKCDSGMSAMTLANDAYTSGNLELLTDITKYNEFDCKVLWEILNYLRHNHSI
jgi:hypothetical protein